MEDKKLEVFYQQRHVGTLAQMPDKRVAFQYDNEWIEKGFSISPFSLPLNNNVFVPKESSIDYFDGLFGVFADSLPDSWGRLLLDRYLSSCGIKRSDISTLDKLAFIGASGMGALEYVPARESDYNIDIAGLSFDKIALECEKILSSKISDSLDLLYKIGGSSGGTRPKILLSMEDKEWIIKFPSKDDPHNSGKREYDYYKCAKKCGITMSESRLLKSDICDGYFATERFDRKGKEKIFTETTAGLLEVDFKVPTCDYATILKVVNILTKENKKDQEELFKVMCFNVLAENKDDHTKNFSLMYTEDNGWHLAPAYDLTKSDTYWGEHTTSVNGKGKNISKEDLIEVGINGGISSKKCNDIYEEIKEKTKLLLKYIDETKKTREDDITFMQRLEEFNNEK